MVNFFRMRQNSLSGCFITKYLNIKQLHKYNPLCPSLGMGAKRI